MRHLLLSAALASLPALAEEAAPPAAPVAETVATTDSTPAPVPPAERAPFAASGEGCEVGRAAGLPEGPVPLAWYEADVGTGRRTCGRTEFGVGTRLRAIIDTPGFYGNIGASALLFGSYAFSPRTELFGTLEAYDFQFVQNATLQGTAGTLGQLTVGATHQVFRYGQGGIVSATARLMLPTALSSPTRTVGGEVGAAWSHRFSDRLRFHGFGSVDLTAGLGAAAPLPRVGVHLNGGAEYVVCSGFSAVLDGNLHFGRRALFDTFAPALGLRARLWRGLGLELAAALPLVGAERTDASLGLRLAWRAE
ncbi:MAG: hypothetical protein RL653_1703 [Pseudomonadota bacterium]|jgi:hypothetical protein